MQASINAISLWLAKFTGSTVARYDWRKRNRTHAGHTISTDGLSTTHALHCEAVAGCRQLAASGVGELYEHADRSYVSSYFSAVGTISASVIVRMRGIQYRQTVDQQHITSLRCSHVGRVTTHHLCVKNNLRYFFANDKAMFIMTQQMHHIELNSSAGALHRTLPTINPQTPS